MGYDSIWIPSHRRSGTLATKTLPQLLAGGCDPGAITIFVNDEQDALAYAEADLGVGIRISGASNATEAFNAIHDAAAPGQRVVVLEDDVELVEPGEDGKPRRLVDVHGFLERSFMPLRRGGIWGIAPHSNAFYFSGKVTRSLKLVVAHCFGFVGSRCDDLRVTCPSKTDYERTCRYFVRYGFVVRHDMVGVKTKSYVAAGGMQAVHSHSERAALERASVDYITRRWPHLVAEKKKASSPFAEMRFRRKEATDPGLLQAQQRVLDARSGM